MFTLPTKPWMHITSKLLVSMVWMFVSGIIALFSIIIISMDKVSLGEMMRELSYAFSEIYNFLGSSFYLVVIEVIIGAFLSLASTILIIYASIALGHLFNRHRILASFGAFLALNTITQILFTIAGTVAFNVYRIGTSHPLESAMHSLIFLSIIFMGLITAAYFVTANIILSKKLNLE
jgi:hypothetical protein